MKATLFLLYLRLRAHLPLLTAIALIPVGLNLWFSSKINNNGPWQVIDVVSGNSFTVTRGNQTKNVTLCGVLSSGMHARNTLKSLLSKGNGSVALEKTGDFSEAWILLMPDFETQIHLNTWMIETGVATVDAESAPQCLIPEALTMAQAIAQPDQLGIWRTP